MAASKDRRQAAAKKRASVRAQERTRRTMSTPGKVQESGGAQYAAVRLAQAGVRSAIKAVGKQNKAASTYRSVDPKRSEAAKRAAETRKANIEAKRQAAKESGRRQGAVTGAALGIAASGLGGAAGANSRRNKSKPVTTSEPNRRQMARNRRVAAAKRNTAKKK